MTKITKKTTKKTSKRAVSSAPKKVVKTKAPKAIARQVADDREESRKAGPRRSLAGAAHGILWARAGTGKTFTQIIGVANIYRGEKIPDSFTFRGPKGGEREQADLSTLWGKVEREMSRWQNPLTGHWEYPPYGKEKRIVPSPEQKKVWDFMAKEKPRTICYAAFNNSIVDDFGEKYQWLVDLLDKIGVKLTFSTINSLGNQVCRQAYNMKGWKSVNKYRTSDMLSVLWQKDLREIWKEKAEVIQAIQELVRLSKTTLVGYVGAVAQLPSDQELDDLAIHFGVIFPGEEREDIYRDVRTLLRQAREVPSDGTGKIDFDDQIWLPVVNDLKVEPFDLLMIDEGQDLSRCKQELLLKFGKRILIVGDDKQAIYGFAGADVGSMERMERLLHEKNDGRLVENMRLTETRRCGKAIVQEANRFVEDFTAHESNGSGKVSRCNIEQLDWDQVVTGADPYTGEQLIENVAPAYSLGEGDFVLCRTNAPLVKLAFKMLKAGKRVNIKGRDIGEGLKAFIKKSKCKEVGEFLIWLDNFERTETERINKRRNPDADALVALQDKCACLRVFSEGAMDLKAVNKAIDEVFKGKVCPKCGKSYGEEQKTCWEDRCKEQGKPIRLVTPKGTLCSSVHRAKGMEAKRVFILRPDLMPHKKAKTKWEQEQEVHLQYVAVTRAIEELIYVDGKDDSHGE